MCRFPSGSFQSCHLPLKEFCEATTQPCFILLLCLESKLSLFLTRQRKGPSYFPVSFRRVTFFAWDRSANHQKVSLYVQPFKSRLWASRGVGHAAPGSMKPGLFSMWIQTYGKHRFSCIVIKKPFRLSVLPAVFLYIHKYIYLRDLVSSLLCWDTKEV